MHMFRCTVNRRFDRANQEYLQLSCRSVRLSCVSSSTVFTWHNEITHSAQFWTSLASMFNIMLYRLPGKSLEDFFKDSLCTFVPWWSAICSVAKTDLQYGWEKIAVWYCAKCIVHCGLCKPGYSEAGTVSIVSIPPVPSTPSAPSPPEGKCCQKRWDLIQICNLQERCKSWN